MALQIRQALRQRVQEPLLLQQAVKVAGDYRPEQRKRVQALDRAARARARAAYELRDERSFGAALALLRETCRLSITALLVARGEHDGDDVLVADVAWQRLEELVASGTLKEPPEGFENAKALMKNTDPLAADRVPRDAVRDLLMSCEAAALYLFRSYEARSVRGLKVRRVLRVGALALAVLGLCALLIAEIVAPTNLAKGKHVTASSRRPGTPDPAGLTDGDRDALFGLHTNTERSAWALIDLEQEYALSRVVVWHRKDGYHNEALPLALEISSDNRSWQEVAVRSTIFTDADPWSARLDGPKARYIRLRVKKSPGYLALNEVEVFGKKP